MPERDDRAERVGEAVAWYFQAAEAGRTPTPADFLARFPNVQPELESFLADKAAFYRAVGPPADPDATIPPSTTPNRDTIAHVPSEGKDVILPPSGAQTAEPSLGSVRYFGDYELLAEIARGGMGVVFKARQVSLNREVALKMILSGQLASTADVARFRAEAEAAANLDHPNILPIYEVGQHLGQQYFAMKLASGGSLAGKMAELKNNPRAAVAVFAKLCRAVDFAHRRGILHRDLKPGNILLDADGTPYVTDFGLAKKVEGDSNLTQSGAIVGTPSYMAPEQARAEKGLTTAADVYALGAILYELVTGQPPFRGPTVLDTILQVIEKEPADPRTLNPKADRDLSVIALKCLEKEPGKRYESAAALADDLDRWMAGEPTLARPLSPAGQAWRWVRRYALAAIATGALGVAWGLAATLGCFAVAVNDGNILLPPGASLLDPVVWIDAAREVPAARAAVIIVGTALTVGIGWFVRLAARPRTTRAALGAAATVGLLATLVAFSILGTGITASIGKMAHLGALGIHPVEDREDFGEKMTQAEEQYLAQYLPPELRHADAPTRQYALQSLWRKAVSTNQLHAGIIAGWVVLLVVGAFLMTLSLSGTWTADHMVRSDRGPAARVACYLELYLPTVGLVLWCLGAFVLVVVIAASTNIKDGPPWAPVVLIGVFGGGLVGLAHIGVIRRWHLLIRVGLYFGWMGCAIGAGWFAGWL